MAPPTILRLTRAVRVAAAAAFAATAAHHLARALAGEPSVARHAAFVAIDLAAALVVARRPRWALVPVLVLFAQQLTSHGVDLVQSLRGPEPVDAVSLGVLAFFVLLIAALVVERRAGTPGHPRGAPRGS